ncbi:molybdopterin molybdenumtransferase MoeA [Novosphingobium sp. PC22D]|uniref:molybdopterin molybdotransferase MoeA n=1 Tax=Novosphingobium sp. PC22D TaxID=1962403 RepID=UPI000BF2195E|nr:molybdopterin molybdotransferase MoeA [Novosphingobium sp. PC22D]PEQ13405.1 molybdopterin molybdenumtransferase MoeA [Novosphingobium sp. PC22D]
MAKVPPIPLTEAQARLLALADPLTVEHVDIEGSVGRYLAEDLQARRTQPAADLSAMDGYAVRADDLAGPWRVIGESAAGHPHEGALASGEAVRIATGALLPRDGNVVLLQEDIARDGETIRFTGELPSPVDKHIRRCGMDFELDSMVLAAGTRIGPAQAALAIAAGHKHLPVRRRPQVAVMDSGDELAADPELCALHQIPASNSQMLAAMARSLPVDAKRLGPVPDTMDALAQAFAEASDSDLVVTSGGASVGDHDLIKPALEAWGAKLDFWRVAIKPGKPILVATRDLPMRRQVIIGLPGNPVSSFVTAHLFVLPLLRAMLGAARPLPARIRTRLGAPVPANGPRQEFRRALWDGEVVVPVSEQDSAALAALASSNVLIDRPANAPAAAAGEDVWCYPLENGGIA